MPDGPGWLPRETVGAPAFDLPVANAPAEALFSPFRKSEDPARVVPARRRAHPPGTLHAALTPAR
ncbi:hypothetical protein [Streptomyces sp. SBT349]|uniref:hypothetical protein n=1 Tax=Streptomyces sp. SBT349 TaxID=1580539 RepID=UPI00066EC589|nr:hypothetical protein [Streptomyces sp. SBT349]